MAMHNTHACSHSVLHDLLCLFREGSYLRHRVTLWHINIHAGDSLVYNFSNINSKTEIKN